MAPTVERTVVRKARRIDPASGLDNRCDLLVERGIVARVGAPGASLDWPEATGARVIEPPRGIDVIVCPGLVDLHTHVYGAAGICDIDRIGVRSGVPIIVDAGGAGAATIDDFVTHRLRGVSTRVRHFLSIESAGIVDRSASHNTTRPPTQMQTPSMHDFLGAIERHSDRIAGLKVWATADVGLPWVDHAASLSELIERPLFTHIGDVESSTGAAPITGDVLDRLQGGDVVTHCYTGQPGALIDQRGHVDNSVIAAASRGVLFDAAPGGENLSISRAQHAIAQGWLPDTISSDLHRWCIEHPVCSLPNVLSMFLALGLTLQQVIERASVAPAAVIDEQIGSPVEGATATLSVLGLREASTIFSDGSGETIVGHRVLEPIGCFLDGVWHGTGQSEHEPSFEPPALHRTDDRAASGHRDTPGEHERQYLAAVEVELGRLAASNAHWCGHELHRVVHRARRDCGVDIAAGLDTLFGHLGTPSDQVMGAGWFLESLGPDATMARLDAALRS